MSAHLKCIIINKQNHFCLRVRLRKEEKLKEQEKLRETEGDLASR